MDKYTFGETPGAMYLTCYLSENGTQALTRAVGKKLTKWRQVMKDLTASHIMTDELHPRTFNILLQVLDTAIRDDAKQIKDAHVAALVTNVLIGELKTWKTRAQTAAQVQRELQRETQNGETVPLAKILPRAGEETEAERVARLRERSINYLQRKGKKNTLY